MKYTKLNEDNLPIIDRQNLAHDLKLAFRASKLTKKDFAKDAGVDVSSLRSVWELRGQKVDTFLKIVAAIERYLK